MNTKQQAKHTPGHWEARSRSMTDNSLVVMSKEWNVETRCEEICCIRPGSEREYGPQDERDKANARLIAAAPELLKACKATFVALDNLRRIGDKQDWESFEPLHGAYNATRKALAKAKGEA